MEKRLWAKTGTKEQVSALAGYILTRDNQRLAFAVILNNYKDSTHAARTETDRLAQMLGDF